MKYIAHNKEVSRDIYYFCLQAKNDKRTFVFLNLNDYYDARYFINNNPEYDYYIDLNETSTAYYTKDECTTEEWYEKDRLNKCTVEEMKKRYSKSKLKDIISFEQWYTKNGWSFMSSVNYDVVRHNIPSAKEDFINELKISEQKLFSDIVKNSETVSKLNEMRDKEILYVLRDGSNTEIIYIDCYLEI